MDSANRSPRIIVGVDGSEQSIDALREAAKVADAFHGTVEAIIVWEPVLLLEGYYPPDYPTPRDEAERLLDQTVATAFPVATPPGLTTVALEGTAARVLIDESRRADLLVLGSRGRGGFAGLLLGSVSRACASHAHCPVLIMHGEHDATDEEPR